MTFEEWHAKVASCCLSCAESCSHKEWERRAWDAAIADLVKDRDAFLAELKTAGEALTNLCKMYCQWYDTGVPGICGSDMAYELISGIRQVLAQPHMKALMGSQP